MGLLVGASAAPATDWLTYSNQNAVRNLPLSPQLVAALGPVARDLGVTFDVYSGGQDPNGPTVGGPRHGHGNAADVRVLQNGQLVNFETPEGRALGEQLVARARQSGITGIGYGVDYMGPHSWHLGFGPEAVWGADGRSANAEEWLVNAFYGSGPTQARADAGLPLAQGGNAVQPRGLLNMPQMPEERQLSPRDALQQGMQSGAIFDGIAGALNSLRHRPSREMAASLASRDARRNEVATEARARQERTQQTNATLRYLQQTGAPAPILDLAQADAGTALDLWEQSRRSPEGTALMQNVEFIMAQSPDTSFEEALQMAKSGQTITNIVPMPEGESELLKKLGGKTADVWSSYVQAGNVAAGNLQDFEVMGQLLEMAPQGGLTGQLARAFPQFTTAGAALNSMVKRMAPSFRIEGSGSTSDIEYQGMIDGLPGMQNLPGANAIILGTMQAKARINVERGNVVNRFMTGEINQAEAVKLMADLDSRSIKTPELQSLIDAASGGQEGEAASNPAGGAPAMPKPGDVVDGYRFKGGDPGSPNSWEQVR